MLRRIMTRVGHFTGHPIAIGVIALYALSWLFYAPSSFDWNAVAEIATLIMTVLIQRSTHRDVQAVHAKLDELLKVTANAKTELAGIDREELEVIEKHRASSEF